MIQKMQNSELIFLAYLYRILDFPKSVLIDTENVMLREFIGQGKNNLQLIPIEIISIGCLLYSCERNSFKVDANQLNAIIDFLFPDEGDGVRLRIARIKERTKQRFDGNAIIGSSSRFADF